MILTALSFPVLHLVMIELTNTPPQATVLIETLPAAFEMDEILWELREHSAGLNCGRWDYIFSLIKTLREDPKAIMPDRSPPLLAVRPTLQNLCREQ